MPDNYTPQTWADGPDGLTPINAARLTHVEQGIDAVDAAQQAHEGGADPHGDRAYTDAQIATRAALAHAHATGDVTGLLEYIQDALGAAIVQGSGITVAYDDTAGTVTISGSTIDAEQVQDIVGAMMVAGSNIGVTYNDGAGTFTIDVTGVELAGAVAAHAGDAVDAHDASAISVDAAGFNGILATSDDTVQKVAQKLDDLTIDSKPTGAVWVYLVEPMSPTEPYLYLHDNGDSTFSWRAATGVPSAPSGLNAVRGDTTADLSWSAPSSLGLGALTYTVEKSIDTGSTWSAAASGLTGTSTTITSLTNGTAIRFRAKAVTTWGSSAWDTMVANVTPAGIPATPSAPSGTAASTQVALTWTAPNSNGATITNFRVEQRIGTGGSWTTVTTINALSHTVTGLTNGTEYFFRVVAINAVGESAPSAASSGFTPASTGGTYTFDASGTYMAQQVNYGTASGSAVSFGQVAWYNDGDFDNVDQVFIEFDTSSIPDGETITSATIEIAGGTATVDTAGLVEVFAFDFGTFDAAADHRSVGTAGTLHALFTGSKRVATRSFNSSGSDWPNASTRVAYTNDGGNLVANISKTGPTRFVLGVDKMRTNDAPAVQVLEFALSGAVIPRLTVVTS